MAPAARRGIRGFAWAGRLYGSERVQLGCPAASRRSCRWRMYGSPTRPNCFSSCEWGMAAGFWDALRSGHLRCVRDDAYLQVEGGCNAIGFHISTWGLK